MLCFSVSMLHLQNYLGEVSEIWYWACNKCFKSYFIPVHTAPLYHIKLQLNFVKFP